MTDKNTPTEAVAHSNTVMNFSYGMQSNVGCVRKVNEDSMTDLPEFGTWVVADGMGGHAAGDFASQSIVASFDTLGVPGTIDDLRSRFMDRLAGANQVILDKAAELQSGTIGATIVGFLTYEDDFACIWSGDSRIYLIRGGHLQQVTVDHTELQQLLDAGSISPEEAQNWPRRNVITRAIGVMPQIECDVVQDKMLDGDVFVLCSDGLTEHITDPEIEAVARRSDIDEQQKCDLLIQETLARGARDNVTVIVVKVTDAPPLEEISNLPYRSLSSGW